MTSLPFPIIGAERLSGVELIAALDQGARLVRFDVCISVLLLTVRRQTDVVFVPQNGRRFIRGLPYVAFSALFGWWGLPWGVILTPIVCWNNLNGGVDVTEELRPFLTTS